MQSNDYVLVTPARNEAAYLPGIIRSVVNQVILPMCWVIVSDGSTDDTDAIAVAAAKEHSFIRFVSAQSGGQRSFGSKARAFQAGFELVRNVQYSFVGNLDADVTFEPGYYERMLAEMGANKNLGIATGVCWDKTPKGYRCVTISHNHAVGAVHFFRRECFEAIGGYRPVSVGGMDSLAVLTARMKGWQTQVFPDFRVYHHKPVDSANTRSSSAIAYRAGLTEYHIGTHPLFTVVKALRRWRGSPPVLGSLIRLTAYFRLWIFARPRDASEELTRYVHREQMARLRALLSRGKPSGKWSYSED